MEPTTNPFGTIERVGPAVGAESPQAGFSALLVAGINIFLIVGGIAALIYMLWGALDYVTSGGEEEKIQKARSKITFAAVGAILLIVVISVWSVITGSVLGIVQFTDRGFSFDLPRVGCLPEGAECNLDSSEQCCSGKCDASGGAATTTCVPN
jgi:hypothetical protein